jgi:NAD(P)-dependent dehydrogenase (short-subunit alcohol dehydrogenase family)
MNLAGHVAIVTGGGTGIGLGIAKVLAERGARLALLQDRPFAAEVLAGCGGERPLTLEVDISDNSGVKDALGTIEAHFGSIDIVVNNAAITGMAAATPFLDSSPEHLSRIVDVNFKGAYFVSQHAARSMVRLGRRGSIIHIASVGAFAAQEHASAYCATKAALVSLAQTTALELAPHGIRVNAIAPGDILTPASATIVADLQHSGASGRYTRVTPIGRRGTPEDIGRAVAFLASAEAAFITGATLVVDGGFLSY